MERPTPEAHAARTSFAPFDPVRTGSYGRRVSLPFAFEHTYARLPEHFFAQVHPTPVARPSLLALNTELAEALGLDCEALASAEGVEILAGNRIPTGAEPIALAYAGHLGTSYIGTLEHGRLRAAAR